jgi:hypothetical protein
MSLMCFSPRTNWDRPKIEFFNIQGIGRDIISTIPFFCLVSTINKPHNFAMPGKLFFCGWHSLFSSMDKELQFETVINKRRVRVKFDLSKMKYKGKLEI